MPLEVGQSMSERNKNGHALALMLPHVNVWTPMQAVGSPQKSPQQVCEGSLGPEIIGECRRQVRSHTHASIDLGQKG
jgi:hypothetical protein